MKTSTRVALAVIALLAPGVMAQPCVYEWTPMGSGMASTGVLAVRSLHVHDDGTGPALYAGGQFTTAGGVAAPNIAKWNGTAWSSVGGGVNGTVFGMTTFDDGTGPALYASGSFGLAGTTPANRIAKWDGTTWSALSSGMSGSATMTMVPWDDGDGTDLYVGGNFVTAGGVNCYKIARWDGSAWSPLGAGIGTPPPTAPIVNALAVYNDGSGSALYAAGAFTVADGGAVPASRIVKWDGTGYSTLTSGVSGTVNALAVYNDGVGSALFVGGAFLSAGGFSISFLARWDGESWQGVGGGVNGTVNALAVFDDGTGPALYVGGEFTNAGGVEVRGLAKWDGTAWAAVGAGVEPGQAPLAMAALGDVLFAGGNFATMNDGPASRIARFECNPVGACCLPSGACEVRTEHACGLAGGVYRGDGTACETSPACPQPATGACCTPSGCVITWSGDCADLGGVYMGDNTTCGPSTCAPFVFEAEPNNFKVQSNEITLADGQSIVGRSAGSTGSGDLDSPDYFLVRTPPAPTGIYEHKVTLTTFGAPGHTVTLPAIDQVAVGSGPWPCGLGTPGVTDQTGQQAQLAGSARVNYWYGFGREERLYYAVAGAWGTNGVYTATLETTPITPTHVGSYLPGEITITTQNQGHTSNTHLRVFDADMRPIPGYANDGAATWGGAPSNAANVSYLRRSYEPGEYTFGIAFNNFAMDLGAACDDFIRTGVLMEFPDVGVDTGTSTGTNVSFSINDASGNHPFAASRAGRARIAWFRFTVAEACDGDVNCDFALDGFDVETQEKAVGGDMADYCHADPDFNGDFALDGFDVEAVEVVVGGGPCP